ncbi:TPA: 50S ribosomal protein L22, partial [Campylobacter coli]|nr:50S ribosomal protein L22 [Campylobacter coli]
ANGGFEANEVVVKSCRVDAGAVLKRFRPRARGSASRIRKPTSHILVEVVKAEVKTEAKKAVAKKTPVKKTSTKKVTAEKES